MTPVGIRFICAVGLLLLVTICYPATAQVVINEVFVHPAADPVDPFYQSMVDCANPTFGEEWIELYNTSRCDTVDLGCYMLGAQFSASNGATFAFPSGTVIPPLSFIVVGGANVPGVDFTLSAFCGTANLCSPGRWTLENDKGWVALYDPAGNVADAVFWTPAAGQAPLLTSDAVYGSQPCVPATCAVSGLKAASTMTPGTEIAYAGKTAVSGLAMARPSDGAAGWQTDVAPTPGACNGTCATASDLAVTVDTFANETCRLNNGWIKITISGGAAPYRIDWSNNENTDSIGGLSEGSYSVSVTDASGCEVIGFFPIANVGEPLAAEIIPQDTTIFPGDSIRLTVHSDVALFSYLWSPENTLSCSACAAPYANPVELTRYTVIVTDSNGCEATASVVVNIVSDENSVFIPTAFTPGIPGPNAAFMLRSPKISALELHVYDRWGNELFSTTDMNQPWDGTRPGGQMVDTGIYVYYAVIKFISGKTKIFKGDVAVLR
ncbi:MAG: hypothetical protein KatS3mg031_0653 [Chitinophagales bacterium]|nr:MAG: hypothetical protein KatS3mg031_0653 [Chitinophagales bacterium]